MKNLNTAQRLLVDRPPDIDPPSGVLGAVGCQSHGATFPRLASRSLPEAPLYPTSAETELALINAKWLAGLTGDPHLQLLMLRLRRELEALR